MKDRVPLYPGRIKLLPVAGQENTFDLVRADQPTQAGDPLNKATLLKDATAALYGLDADAVPDDVLALLKTLVDNAQASVDGKIVTGSYAGTGVYGETSPCRLTFDGVPCFALINGIQPGGSGYCSLPMIKPMSSCVVQQYRSALGSTRAYEIQVNWGANSLEWYTSDSAIVQLNDVGKTYYWMAIIA